MAQMDSHGRKGHALRFFPVASWRATRDHVPVVCSLPLSWKFWFHRARHACQKLLHEVWKTPYHPVRPELQEKLQEPIRYAPVDLQHLPDLVIGVLLESSKVLHRALKPPSISWPRHRSIVAQLWYSYGIVRRTNTCSLQDVFRVWFLVAGQTTLHFVWASLHLQEKPC